MKDHWMNVGHDEEELKPYIEPEPDFNDSSRIGASQCLHQCVDAINEWEKYLQSEV